jgi:hypothetical protein
MVSNIKTKDHRLENQIDNLTLSTITGLKLFNKEIKDLFQAAEAQDSHKFSRSNQELELCKVKIEIHTQMEAQRLEALNKLVEDMQMLLYQEYRVSHKED